MGTDKKIADTVLDLVGGTPMVRLNRVVPAGSAQIVAKIESMNPAGSVKDRIALNMIETAEREGRLKPGDTIVEPTSRNTGIGLAMVAAVKGYRLIVTMPEDMSLARRDRIPGLLIVAVEPTRSPVLQGGRAGVHAIQGIGASFVPNILNREIYDEIMAIGDDDAIEMSRRLCREEGLLVGISAGANVVASLRVAKRLGEGKRVVTVLPDTGVRYLTMEA